MEKLVNFTSQFVSSLLVQCTSYLLSPQPCSQRTQDLGNLNSSQLDVFFKASCCMSQHNTDCTAIANHRFIAALTKLNRTRTHTVRTHADVLFKTFPVAMIPQRRYQHWILIGIHSSDVTFQYRVRGGHQAGVCLCVRVHVCKLMQQHIQQKMQCGSFIAYWSL